MGSSTDNLNSHEGNSRISSATNVTSGTNDATVDSLGVGADRNGILMVIVATSVAHVINMTSAVFVISNTVINLFGNHLIDSILTDSIGNSIHHNCDFIINFVAIDIFSLFQSLNIADVPNSNAIDRIITNSNLQTIV